MKSESVRLTTEAASVVSYILQCGVLSSRPHLHTFSGVFYFPRLWLAPVVCAAVVVVLVIVGVVVVVCGCVCLYCCCFCAVVVLVFVVVVASVSLLLPLLLLLFVAAVGVVIGRCLSVPRVGGVCRL